jgi:hypothetical protein
MDNQEFLKQFLDAPFWPTELESSTFYARIHDDHDGTYSGVLRLMFGCDGDAHLSVVSDNPFGSLRFRTFSGGGRSLRTRAALLILAEAIRLDNEENPDYNGFK